MENRKLSCKKTFVFLIILFMIFSNHEITQAKKKTLGGEKDGCLALNYHRVREDTMIDKLLSAFSSSKELKIYSVTDTQFESHMKWLKNNNAHFITLEELIQYKEKGEYPDNCVWVNFDDMDESVYEHAFPILKKYDIPATGFVITGEVGSDDFHNINLSSKKDLLEMKKSGLWEFASHTNDLHLMKGQTSLLVTEAKDKKIDSDINKSTAYIDKELNGDTSALAYPYGQTDDKVVSQLEKGTSIKYGFTLEEKAMKPKDDNYYIPRIMVSDNAFNNLVKEWKGFNHG